MEKEIKWININDKLPEDGEEVLVAMKNCNLPIQVYRYGKQWYGSLEVTDSMVDGYCHDREIGDYLSECITHWMPLPEPPKYDN